MKNRHSKFKCASPEPLSPPRGQLCFSGPTKPLSPNTPQPYTIAKRQFILEIKLSYTLNVPVFTATAITKRHFETSKVIRVFGHITLNISQLYNPAFERVSCRDKDHFTPVKLNSLVFAK